MKSSILNCGFKQIPYIFNGKINDHLSENELVISVKTLEQLQVDRVQTRLSENYKYENLHLDQMYLYNILYNEILDQPVLVSGVQKIGKLSARVFSRYFVFPNYKTNFINSGILNKIDDFELLKSDINATIKSRPFIFWSRDKGINFFNRLKLARPDIFEKWEIMNSPIQLMYKNNYQGIFYLNKSDHLTEDIINSDLKFKGR